MGYSSSICDNLGKVLKINGTSQYLQLEDTDIQFTTSDAFTIDFFGVINQPNSPTVAYNGLFTNVRQSAQLPTFSNGGNGIGLLIRDTASGPPSSTPIHLFFDQGSGNPFVITQTTTSVPYNQLIRITSTYAGDLIRPLIYFDAVEQPTTQSGTIQAGRNLFNTFNGYRIGATAGFVEYTQLDLYSLKIFDKVLSQAEIDDLTEWNKTPLSAVSNLKVVLDVNKRPKVSQSGTIFYKNPLGISDAVLTGYSPSDLGYATSAPYIPDPTATLDWFYYDDLINPITEYIGY